MNDRYHNLLFDILFSLFIVSLLQFYALNSKVDVNLSVYDRVNWAIQPLGFDRITKELRIDQISI